MNSNLGAKMANPELSQEQRGYLSYINDGGACMLAFLIEQRMDAVDTLQLALNNGVAFRIGQAVVGEDVAPETVSRLQYMYAAGRLGAAIIDGEWTKIAADDASVIGDEAVVLDCELTNSSIRRALVSETEAHESIIQDSVVLGVPPKWQGAKTQRSVLHNMEIAGGSKLTYVVLKNGTFENVNGSTDGNIYAGSLRNTFIGYDTTTGTFRYS
jgi:hypothetical protein